MLQIVLRNFFLTNSDQAIKQSTEILSIVELVTSTRILSICICRKFTICIWINNNEKSSFSTKDSQPCLHFFSRIVRVKVERNNKKRLWCVRSVVLIFHLRHSLHFKHLSKEWVREREFQNTFGGQDNCYTIFERLIIYMKTAK